MHVKVKRYLQMSDWSQKLEPLLEKYGKQKHPLDYNNRYQLIVMVILAAQASDNQINKISPKLFEAYPSISDLKNSNPEDLYPLLSSIRGYRKKAKWIVDIAKVIGDDSNIPTTIGELTKLSGVGRKTANTVIRESGDNAEGIIVDLHVLRVAPRLGIATGTNSEKIEKQLMDALPKDKWNEIGMAFSFHGREICRPKPICDQCIVNQACNYYQTLIKTR